MADSGLSRRFWEFRESAGLARSYLSFPSLPALRDHTWLGFQQYVLQAAFRPIGPFMFGLLVSMMSQEDVRGFRVKIRSSVEL